MGQKKMLFDKLKSSIERKMRPPANVIHDNSIINQILLSSIPRQSPASASSRFLLDCGCGNGEKIVDIQHNFPDTYKIIALDIHYPDLLRCQKNVSEDVNIIQGSGLNLPLQDDTIDIVISNQVLEHIPQYSMYLSEVARVLKPNGFFLVSTPNAHCPRNTFLRLLGQKPLLRWANIHNLPQEEFRGHTQEFTEEEFLKVSEKYGFVVFKSMSILPHPTLSGNWVFNIYSILEFGFFLSTRPFVSKGYSKNINILFKLKR